MTMNLDEIEAKLLAEATNDVMSSAQTTELDELHSHIKELENRLELKKSYREKNFGALAKQLDESFFTKLDSSLKKNTAWVKKLKTLNESQRQSLMKDFAGLNLSKYVAEIATAMVEVKLKMADVPAALEICSLVHQRYCEFSSCLMEEWKKVFPRKKCDKLVNPSKLRVDLRLFAELVAWGVLDEKQALPVLGALLGFLINNDKEEHVNVGLVSSFVKYCGDDYAGLSQRKYRLMADNLGLSLPTSNIFSEDRRRNVVSLLTDYYDSLEKHLMDVHKEVQKLERYHQKQLLTRGEVHQDSKNKLEASVTVRDKLLQSTLSFAELLDKEPPVLPENKSLMDDDEMVLTGVHFAQLGGTDGEGGELWEDDDTRMFYENLPELRAMLPGILYKDSENPTKPIIEDELESMEVDKTDFEESTEDQSSDSKPDGNGELENANESEAIEEPEPVECEEDQDQDETPDEAEDGGGDGEEITGSLLKQMMDTFVSTLPNQVNRELIDKSAIDFVTNLNTRANRKKLTRALLNVHRNRLDLLPFYSRLIAVLYPVMPDVGTETVQALIRDFRREHRKKDQVKIETKIKICRFIGELVKFKIFPKSEALHCVKMLLFDFRHHSIDMACNMLDVCGYFLYHSPDSHPKTRVLLEQMMRKRSNVHMDARYHLMIDNAFYTCNPPQGGAMQRKERPPEHEYIRRLIFKDLNKTSVEKVLRQLRKFDWEDKVIVAYIIRCLSSPWNVRFNCIHCLASLLAGLMWYYEHVGHTVVDNVLEDIRLGMEINHPKYNQRRIADVKYLGEMYNYRCVDSSIIFTVLYSLISFGTTTDPSQPPSPIDPPEHLLRIRIACVLLDACGHYFDRGASKRKLECYLTYLQRYYWVKRSYPCWTNDQPFPVEVHNVMKDTIEVVRPKFRLFADLSEAKEGVSKIEEEYRARVEQALKFVDTGDSTDEAVDEADERDRELGRIDECEEDGTSRSESLEASQRSENNNGSQTQQAGSRDEEEGDEEDEEEEDQLDGDYSDQEVSVRRKQKTEDQDPEDEDFLSAFDKMMAECVQQRMQETVKVPQADFSVPTNLPKKNKIRFADQEEADDEAEEEDEEEEDEETGPSVNFVLMTKGRGNKPSYKNLKVPMTSELAQSVKNREEAARREKEQVKQLTLNMSKRIEEEERLEAELEIKATLFQQPRRPQGQQNKFQHQKGAPNPTQIYNQWR